MIVRDRDFALCIAHEEEGQGPSIERLILDRSFKEAASLLEPGVSIPVAILPTDAAPWLGAWLDERGLQLDRDGDDWFVTKRGERGADLAARLGVAIHVVVPPLLFLAFAFFSACTPPPEGRLVDADAALSGVLEVITGQRTSGAAKVYVVEPDPACWQEIKRVAFKDLGTCVLGMTFNREEIYLVDTSAMGGRFSDADALPHEAQHLRGREHPGVWTWPAGTREAEQIAQAQAFLLAHPDLDRIPGASK